MGIIFGFGSFDESPAKIVVEPYIIVNQVFHFKRINYLENVRKIVFYFLRNTKHWKT